MKHSKNQETVALILKNKLSGHTLCEEIQLLDILDKKFELFIAYMLKY